MEELAYKFSGRYSEILVDVLQKIGAIKMLREDFHDDYQGHVDVDALLSDGRVYSYCYYYGSCSGCDEWEAENYSGDKIFEIMKDATYFDDMEQYKKWREKVDDNGI